MSKNLIFFLSIFTNLAHASEFMDASLHYGLTFSQNEELLAKDLYTQITGLTPGESSDKNSIASQFTGDNNENQGSTHSRNFLEVRVPIASLTLKEKKFPLFVSMNENRVNYTFENGVGNFLDPLSIKIRQRGISLSTKWTYQPFALKYAHINLSPTLNYRKAYISATSLLIDSRIDRNELWPSLRASVEIKSLNRFPLSFEISADMSSSNNRSIGTGLNLNLLFN